MDDKEYEILFSHEFEEKENLVNMIALENNKLGVLFETSFHIFDSKTFVKLLTIKENNIIYSKVFEIIDEQKEFIILVSSDEYHIYQIENKTQKLIQKEELFEDEFIIKTSSNIFFIYKDFELNYYKYDKDINKFSIDEFWNVNEPPFPKREPEPIESKQYFEWLDSTLKIKRITYLPSRNSLLLIAEMESRVDILFWCSGHAEIGLEDIVKNRILIYQHVYIFECDLYGEYIQDIYEYEPKQVKFGLLYKDGKVKIHFQPCYYKSNKIEIECIHIALFNKNILDLYNNISEQQVLINLDNGKKEETKKIPYFFCYADYALFLNKNTILVIDLEFPNEIWEYIILNKEGTNLEKYEYSKKKIFDFSMRRLRSRESNAIRGIKMKNKIVYFVSTSDKNYLKIFQILK